MSLFLSRIFGLAIPLAIPVILFLSFAINKTPSKSKQKKEPNGIKEK